MTHIVLPGDSIFDNNGRKIAAKILEAVGEYDFNDRKAQAFS